MGRFDNLGSQSRTFFYNQGLISSEFNKLFSKTVPAGVYEGGEIERIDDYSFKVHPLAVVIEDANISKDVNRDIIGNDIAVRIRTTTITEPISIGPPVDMNKCLIVARYSWLSDNPASIPSAYDPGKGFMDVLVVTEILDTLHDNADNLWTTDLILGKLNFYDNGDGWGIHQTSPVDYTRKSWSPIVNELILPRLKVRSPRVSEDQKKVYVESGFVRGNGGIREVSGASPAISDTGAQPRTDYVYVDENGTIKVEEGVAGASPVPKPYYGRKVLAEIRRGSSRSTIRGDEIFQASVIPISTMRASTLDVLDADSYYVHDVYGFLTIESALKQIWEKAINPIVPEAKTFRSESGVRFEQADKRDAVVVLGRNAGVNGYFVKITPSTLNGNRTLTLANADTVLSEGTMASTNTEQAITGKKEFQNPEGTIFKSASGKTGIVIRGNAAESEYSVIVTQASLTEDRSLILPDADVTLSKGTMVSLEEEQIVSGEKSFSSYPLLTNNDPPSEDLHPVRKKDLDVVKTILSDHKNLTTGSGQEIVPHGIKQGTGNGFDADKLDGADKSTDGTLADNSDSKIPTEKAVKTYADQRLSKSAGSGQALTGTLHTQALRPDVNNERDLGTSTYRYKNGYFAGSVNSGAFDLTSSRKKKKDIENYGKSGLEIVNSLQIVTFKYKADKKGRTHIGIIAEDSPMEVLGDKGKTVSLADSVGVLFKAVQELSARVKSLEEKLEK